MEHHVNVMSTVEIHSVTAYLDIRRKMKTNTFVDVHTKCRVHPRNRYVSENELTQAEVVERLAAIGESLDQAATV